MEIEFNDLLYAQNNNINEGIIYLNQVNYKFTSGNIYALIGDAREVVGRLLVLDKRPTKGELKIDGTVIKKTAKVDNLDELKKSLVFIDFSAKYKFAKESFLDELRFLLGNRRISKDVKELAINSLIMVGLDASYIERNLWELSTSESKKVLLALNLCLNPKVLVLKDLEYGLIYKERIKLKRLLLKLKNYNKVIFIISRDVEFLFDLVNKVLVFDEGQLVLDGDKNAFYEKIIYEYLDEAKIIEFIKYVNSKKHNILPYTDIKELIKGIFRDVESK